MANGYNALNSLTTGTGNVAIGRQVLSKITTGSKNVGIGRQAGIQIVNNSVGGTSLVNGNNNTYIGAETVPSAADVSNETAIGYGATGLGANTVTLGNSSVTVVGVSADNTTDLGSSSKEFKDLYIDGTAYLDATRTDDLIVENAGFATLTGNASVAGSLDLNGGLNIGGTAVTSTAAELNILDGVTATATELNLIDGVTATTDEINILDGVTSTAAELNLVDGSSAGTIVNSKGVIYGSSGEVNATTLQIAGTSITSTAAELNILDGVTATATELNLIDGVTATTAEINYVDGVTSNIQTQIDAKQASITNGSITNAQLAGSIANAKLANSSVSYGGIELALGATDATPAFDLADATNLPIDNISGITANATNFSNSLLIGQSST
tara:strand:+ start:82 stop:1239 length:1158 start_codon:yes stop_codon:yes gene_type:complete